MWDVLVAGAGPAGALAAFVLAQAGQQVILIDEIQSNPHKVGESLPGAARQILQDLGLQAVLESDLHLPCYGNVSAWGSDQLISNDFISDPRGLGWHLNRIQFDEALRLAALREGVVFWRDRIKGVTKNHHSWQIRLKDRKVYSRWFIDATGRVASLARSQGATQQRDIPLFAIYCWAVSSEQDTEARTFIEAVPNGWWYTAKLPNRTRAVIFHTNAEEAKKIRHNPGLWKMYLRDTQYISYCLRHATYTDLPHFIEAGGSCLNNFSGSQWIATGDAALAFDPISSQGIFNALYTGMKAGQTVHAALTGNVGAVDAYIDRLKAIRTAYRRHHDFIYHTEKRWVDNLFWAVRHKC
jgi:flavin-dependent dehydrogenase